MIFLFFNPAAINPDQYRMNNFNNSFYKMVVKIHISKMTLFDDLDRFL